MWFTGRLQTLGAEADPTLVQLWEALGILESTEEQHPSAKTALRTGGVPLVHLTSANSPTVADEGVYSAAVRPARNIRTSRDAGRPYDLGNFSTDPLGSPTDSRCPVTIEPELVSLYSM